MQVKSEVIFRWEYPAWCKDEMLARKQQIKWPPDVPSPTNESYGRISVTATLLFSGHLILYRLDYMARKHRKEIDVGDKKWKCIASKIWVHFNLCRCFRKSSAALFLPPRLKNI